MIFCGRKLSKGNTLSVFICSLYRTALSVENILQRKGVVPATIGIVHGKLIVGTV